jgi:hypothetical protein
MPFYRQKWKRVAEKDVEYYKGEEGLEFIFTYTLKSTFGKSDHILFAYV